MLKVIIIGEAASGKTALRHRIASLCRELQMHVTDDPGVDGEAPARPDHVLHGKLVTVTEKQAARDMILATKQEQREAGRYLGGRAPFGWRVEKGFLVQHEPEQAAIRTILTRRSQGYSHRGIAEELQAHGVQISYVTVRAILERMGQDQSGTALAQAEESAQ